MIRINLLPYRERKRKKTVLREVLLLSGLLLLFFLILGSVYLYLEGSAADIARQLKDAEARLAVLNKQVGDLEKFNKDKKDVEQKLAVIQILDGSRLMPVQMLEELYPLVPVKDMWLEKLSQTEGELRLEGMARNNDVVARFMKDLEKASFSQSIDLLGTKEKEVAGLKLQQFALACALKKGM